MTDYDFELGETQGASPAVRVPETLFRRGWLDDGAKQKLAELSRNSPARRQSLLIDAVERRWERDGRRLTPIVLTASDFDE